MANENATSFTTNELKPYSIITGYSLSALSFLALSLTNLILRMKNKKIDPDCCIESALCCCRCTVVVCEASEACNYGVDECGKCGGCECGDCRCGSGGGKSCDPGVLLLIPVFITQLIPFIFSAIKIHMKENDLNTHPNASSNHSNRIEQGNFQETRKLVTAQPASSISSPGVNPPSHFEVIQNLQYYSETQGSRQSSI